MATIEVRFAPLTAHVRTVRRIALAVARRARVDEELEDEIRLAVGEICSRAVGVHLRRRYDDLVELRMSDDRNHFTVVVVNRGTLADDPAQAMDLAEVSSRTLGGDASQEDSGSWEMTPPGFGLAVVSGLVDDLFVTNDADRTTVRMRWPIVSAATDALGRLSAS